MQRIFSILILLILFSAGAVSLDTEMNPKEITSAVIEIEISGKIHIVHGIDKITYRQTFPLEDANQGILSVTSIPEHTITTDEQGNRKIEFTWVLPESNVLDYKINIQVERKSFPIISTVTDTKEYLKNDNNITKWDDNIKNKAAEITSYNNNLIKAAEITTWIHKNIEYDLSCAFTEEEARWVLENRRGVCTEFSHLLISMARSQNIPARDAVGIVHDGKEWNTHAWTELYYDGKWIPFDPTYNELGFVDSTHVLFSRDTDNAQITEQIEWSSYIAGEKWDDIERRSDKLKEETEKDIYSEKTENKTFLKINKQKIVDTKIKFYDPEVSEDILVNATLEIENLINTTIIGTFNVFIPEEINYVGDEEIFYLEPYKKTNLTLNFKVPKMPDINFRYFFPVIVETFPYTTAESELSVNPKIITGLSLYLTPRLVEGPGVIGREIEIKLNMTNRNPTKREVAVDTCISGKLIDNCEEKIVNLEGNSNKTIEFLFEVPSGNYILSVKANASGSLDEFTEEVYTGVITSEEFVDVPYIGTLRLEGFFIIIFLLIMTAGVILLVRRMI